MCDLAHFMYQTLVSYVLYILSTEIAIKTMQKLYSEKRSLQTMNKLQLFFFYRKIEKCEEIQHHFTVYIPCDLYG